jgi:putative serine protease PepD
MTEHENDPGREPATASAEPTTAEQPAAEQPATRTAQSPWQQQVYRPDERPTVPAGQPAAQGLGQQGYAERPVYGHPGHGQQATAEQPAVQPPYGQPAQPHTGAGYHPAAAYPQPQPVPHNGGGYPPTGNPPPPWAQPAPPAQPANRSRTGRYVAAGAVAVALMLGSAVAGGATVAVLDNDRPTSTTSTGANSAPAPNIDRSSLSSIADKVQPSVVSITTGSGEGSGVILSDDGYVLTNNHVVANAQGDAVNVVFSNGKSARGTIVGTDPKTDLAVVKADGVSGLTPATFGDSSAVKVGDTVLAVGSPLGLQGSVTAGIISAKDRTIRTQDEGSTNSVSSLSGMLQTDAPINPGNSGGALVDMNGDLIGVNSAIATSGQGSGNIGVGFAIPSNKAKEVAEALRNGEKVSHPMLGVQVTESQDGSGALVSAVTANSPAAKAGLQQGDVITSIDGKAVTDSDQLVSAVQSHKVGDDVQITYKRDGSEKTATATLAEAS